MFVFSIFYFNLTMCFYSNLEADKNSNLNSNGKLRDINQKIAGFVNKVGELKQSHLLLVIRKSISCCEAINNMTHEVLMMRSNFG